MSFYAIQEKQFHDFSSDIDIDQIINSKDSEFKKAFNKSVSYQIKNGNNEKSAKEYLIAEILSSGFSESVLALSLEHERLASPKMSENIAPILIKIRPSLLEKLEAYARQY